MLAVWANSLLTTRPTKLPATCRGRSSSAACSKVKSFVRFAMMRDLFDSAAAAKMIGFDVFGDEYPDTAYEEDRLQREKWIREAGRARFPRSNWKRS